MLRLLALLALSLLPYARAQTPPVVAIVLTPAAGARVVSLWSVDAARGAQRRRTLGPSSWSPTPLLESPALLRWQVNDARQPRGYVAQVVAVDLEDFTTRVLLESATIRALGSGGRRALLQTADGACALDPKDGALARLDGGLEVLARRQEQWLIARDGALARFDAGALRVTRRYPGIPALAPDARGPVRWDGGRFVVQEGRFFDDDGREVAWLDFGAQAVVHRELRLGDLELGVDRVVKIRTQATGGSGVPVIPAWQPYELVGRQLRYVERRPAEGRHADLDDYVLTRDAEWVTIDAVTGEEIARGPYAPGASSRRDTLADAGVPEYLRARFEGRAHAPDDEEVAAALLAELDAPPDDAEVRAACRTADRRTLVVAAGDELWFCELATRRLTRLPAPPAWGEAIHVALYPVGR